MSKVADIRARVYCSLGKVISGSISHSYIEGAGIIYYRGNVVLEGAIERPPGSGIQFAYQNSKNQIRDLGSFTVLSSYPDPLARTTEISFGCKLTYKSTWQGTPGASIKSIDEYGSAPCNIYGQVVLGLSAKFIAKTIAGLLGLLGDPLLSNHFSILEFPIDRPLVPLLGDLFISENVVGYVDPVIGRLITKKIEISAGNAIPERSLISLEPIGSGESVSDKALVNYSTRRLKLPQTDQRDWDVEEVIGPDTEISVSWIDEETGEEETVVDSYKPYSLTITTYDDWDRVVSRAQFTSTAIAEANNRYATDSMRSQSGGYMEISSPVGRLAITKFTYRIPNYGYTASLDLYNPSTLFYGFETKGKLEFLKAQDALKTAQECDGDKAPRPEGYEDIIQEQTTVYIEEAELAGTLNIDDYTYSPFDNDVLFVVNIQKHFMGIVESVTTTKYEKSTTSGITKTSTTQELIYAKTTVGQQDLATFVKNKVDEGDSIDLWLQSAFTFAKRIRYSGAEVRIRTEREFGLQRRPSQEDRVNDANAKDIGPFEISSEVTRLAPLDENEVVALSVYNMPYAPDDRIKYDEQNDSYEFIKSDADKKADAFGYTQNQLRKAARNGRRIQVVADDLSLTPLSGISISAGGLRAGYTTNGTVFSFDANGIVASTDGLYKGGGV